MTETGQEKQLTVPTASEIALAEKRENWRETLAECKVIVASGLLPYKKPEEVFVIGMFGRPYGWDLVQSANLLYVVNQRVAMMANTMTGLVYARKAGTITYEEGAGFCRAMGKRTDNGDTYTAEWTLERAKRARLSDKDNWQKYPADMLASRAKAELCRRLWPDVIGNMYTPEEILEIAEAHPIAPEPIVSTLDIDTDLALDSLVAGEPDEAEPPGGAVPEPPSQNILDAPIAQLDFSKRVRSALESLGLKHVSDLTCCTPDELLSVRNFSHISLAEVNSKLAEHGLVLAEGPDEAEEVSTEEPAPAKSKHFPSTQELEGEPGEAGVSGPPSTEPPPPSEAAPPGRKTNFPTLQERIQKAIPLFGALGIHIADLQDTFGDFRTMTSAQVERMGNAYREISQGRKTLAEYRNV